MSRAPLMPKATAVWLVDNTSLSFEQIAAFCGLHVLEVKGIADGDVAHGIKGMDPISSGQLSREEIARAQQDSSHSLRMSESKVTLPEVKTKRGPRYTPVSRRQDRPNAILWLLRSHAELKDSQIMRLVGTTKPTIQAIRERSHWNSPNLQAQDPVTLGLCSQTDLDSEVTKAARRLEKEREAAGEPEKAGTLLPIEETVPIEPAPEPVPAERERDAAVFAKLKQLKGEDYDHTQRDSAVGDGGVESDGEDTGDGEVANNGEVEDDGEEEDAGGGSEELGADEEESVSEEESAGKVKNDG